MACPGTGRALRRVESGIPENSPLSIRSFFSSSSSILSLVREILKSQEVRIKDIITNIIIKAIIFLNFLIIILFFWFRMIHYSHRSLLGEAGLLNYLCPEFLKMYLLPYMS